MENTVALAASVVDMDGIAGGLGVGAFHALNGIPVVGVAVGAEVGVVVDDGDLTSSEGQVDDIVAAIGL